MSARLALPARLDVPAAPPLAADLMDRIGAPLTLDASGVTHLGTPGLQVLLAAARSWREAELPLTLEQPSEALCEQLAVLGLAPADLTSPKE